MLRKHSNTDRCWGAPVHHLSFLGLNHRAAAFVRPDLSLAGSITNIRKIAAIAEIHYVGVIPHNPLSCVQTAACVQIDAAIHNPPVQEHPPDDASGKTADLVDQPLTREGGYLPPPDRPGIGIDLNEEAFSNYQLVPYIRPGLINPDGSLRD